MGDFVVFLYGALVHYKLGFVLQLLVEVAWRTLLIFRKNSDGYGGFLG
jgi:hypothetical protein